MAQNFSRRGDVNQTLSSHRATNGMGNILELVRTFSTIYRKLPKVVQVWGTRIAK
jgi:hypothetical protein